MRTSLVVLVVAISFGVLAMSPNAQGTEKKTIHALSETYKGYASYYDGIDPQFWGYMQQ